MRRLLLVNVNMLIFRNPRKLIPNPTRRVIELKYRESIQGKKYAAESTENRSFEDNFADLVTYKEAFGSCNSFPPNHPLGTWAAFLRAEYRLLKKGQPSLIKLEEIAQLKKVGFRWKKAKPSAS